MLKVLLADDHTADREAVASMLASRGIHVIGVASDGLEAVEQAWFLRPEVVVIEVDMPRMGGREATRIIKDLVPDVRVIGFSRNDHEQTVAGMKSAGACDFVRKGEALDRVYQAILLTRPSRA